MSLTQLCRWIRGSIVGSYQLAITIGLLIAACVNYGTADRNDSGSYRIPIALQFAWGLILIGGMIALPETPRFLIKKGNLAKAKASLSRLRRLNETDPHLQDEIAEIQANHEYELSLGTASYLECFKGNLGKRLATGCLLQALQQLTGVNFSKSTRSVYLVSTNSPRSLLLRHSVLQVYERISECIHHHGHYQCRQRRIDFPWSICRRKAGTTKHTAHWGFWNGNCPVYCRNCWHHLHQAIHWQP